MNVKDLSQMNLNIYEEKKLLLKNFFSFLVTLCLLLFLVESTYGYEYETDRIAKEQQQKIIKLKERIGESYKVIKNDSISFYDSPNILSGRFYVTEAELFIIKDWTASNQYLPEVNSFYKIQFESGKVAFLQARVFEHEMLFLYRNYLTRLSANYTKKDLNKSYNDEKNNDELNELKQYIGKRFWIRSKNNMTFYDSPNIFVSESFVISHMLSFVIEDVIAPQQSVQSFVFKMKFTSEKIAYIGVDTFFSLRNSDSITTEDLEKNEREESTRIQKEWEEREKEKKRVEEEKQLKEKEEKQQREVRVTKKWGKRVAKAIMAEKVFIGMTKAQVEESWGKPKDINRTVGRWGVHEQWVYGDFGPYLYFENGRLTSYQD